MKRTLTSALYERGPRWLQNTLVSAKGAQFRFLRCSQRTMRKQTERLLSSQWWSEERHRAHQTEQMRRLLSHAFSAIPYYLRLKQRLQCEIDDFKTLEDLRRLPVLTKEQVRGNDIDFCDPHVSIFRKRTGFTSGTTGTPLTITETPDSFAMRWAFVMRLRLWAGVSDPFMARRAQFTGRDIVPDSFGDSGIYWRSNIAGNSRLFSTCHISERTAPLYAQALRQFAPELVDGYPSALLTLARLCSNGELRLPALRAVIVTAETLLSDHRREIEHAFGCKVFNQYAATEPSCFWSDCEQGILHVNPEYGISEILDDAGNPAAFGTAGEVVVTSFLNPAMVLIRYRLGDTAIPGPAARCACGHEMPRIDAVVGRRDDVVYIPGRGHLGRLDPVFKGMSNIVEAQIVQEALDRVVVNVVFGGRHSAHDHDELVASLRVKLGNGVQIQVRDVASIPRGPNGKFRAVVSKIDQRPSPR